MIFIETEFKGAYLIEPESLEDERGLFVRTYCRREFEAHGLSPQVVQCSTSFSRKRGTLRGMHYQSHPKAESKLVRCTRGAIYDVVIDIRPNSSTFKRWLAADLTADNRRMLYIPEGCAHGFQTLVDETEVFYQMSEFYQPEAARGVRWNDSAFGIEWPQPVSLISTRDSAYSDFQS